MGFLERVKKKIRPANHVDVELTVPEQFSWNQGHLPVTLTFQGAEEVDRAVASIGFELGTRYKQGGEDEWSAFRITYESRFPVPAGQVTIRHLNLPLDVEAVRAQLVIDPRLPASLQDADVKKAEHAFGLTGQARLDARIFFDHDRFGKSARARLTAL